MYKQQAFWRRIGKMRKQLRVCLGFAKVKYRDWTSANLVVQRDGVSLAGAMRSNRSDLPSWSVRDGYR
jgi:hypothetical protein